MLNLNSIRKDYIWGNESWEVSVHPDGENETEKGSFSKFVCEHPETVGGDGAFPVLIKYIDAAQNLSVQVHPNDIYAHANEGDNGKTEMWYILSAEEGAGIYCGFKRDTSKEEFLSKVKDGTVEELLNFISVKQGDCFLIEAGTVHAIGAGCVICEIQQSSNVTYRVYDYNRIGADGKPRQLHIDKAVDVINFKGFDDRTKQGAPEECAGGSIQTLTDCDYFKCRKLELKGIYSETPNGTFLTVNILSGKGRINGVEFNGRESFFIENGEKLTIEGKAVAILTTRSTLKYYAGIDLGGTFVKCGIIDSEGRLLKKSSRETSGGYESIAKTMAELALELAKEQGVALNGIGIGAPGTVDGKNGVIIYSNNLNWHNVSLKKDIEAMTGLPVFMTNDANAAALGEATYGAGKQYKNIVFVTLGTGVGGGIVIDGRLYEGLCGAGAELGHMIVERNGELCTCGNRGCLEAYASTTALVKQARAYMSGHPESLMIELCHGNSAEMNGRVFFEAVRAGDGGANEVYENYLDSLSVGLINFANIFRPDAIILGGGISAEGRLLTEPLSERLNRGIFGGNDHATVKLLTSKLANDAGLYGAARLAMEKNCIKKGVCYEKI